MLHRSEALRDPRRPVVRRLAPGNFAVGAVAVVGALAMLYLFWGLRRIPVAALPLAAVLIAGGLYLLVRPFADACAACGRTLTVRIVRSSPEALSTATAALRSMEIAGALEALAPDAATGGANVELWYCRSCGNAAMWKGATGRPVVLGGERAKAVSAALVPAEPADGAADE